MNTKIEQLKEYARIITDTPYALKTYLQTYDNTKRKYVPLELFPDQVALIYDYENHNENITRKYRQAGVSTVTAAWISKILQTAKTDKPEKILIVANKRDTAIEMANKIRGFLEQWPPWINVGFSPDKNSESRFKLKNGCEVKAVATSKDALRGYTPTILIFDEAAYIEAGEDFWAASMASLSTGGKIILISCVPKDTYVFTDKGPRQVCDFIDENNEIGVGYFVNEYSVIGKDKPRTSNIMLNNGFQKTLKLHTVNSKIEGTHNHKVWGYSNKKSEYGWFRLDELEVGDFLNVNYGFEKWGDNDIIDFKYEPTSKEKNIITPKIIDENLSYFLGLYISEGSTYVKYNENGDIIGCNITITCGDYIGDYIKSIGLNYFCHDNLHYTVSSKSLYNFMLFLGFDLTSKASNKIIPKRLMELGRNNMVALIQGIFDGDGWSDSKRMRVGISMSSEKLVEQLRMILLNFGILTDYQHITMEPTKKVKVYSESYRISLNSTFSKVFYEKIGFRFERKQKKCQIISKYQIDRADPYDVIPNGSKIIKDLIEKSGVKRKNLQKKIKRIYDQIPKTKHLSRKSFEKILDNIKEINKNIDDTIIKEKIFFDNSKWVKITKIENSENETFDFSLHNNKNDFWCHSVLYNGILGHQTPNGFDPIYYGVYNQSIRGLNNFKISDLKWYRDPRYNKDLKWVKTTDIVHYMLNRELYNDDDVCLYDVEPEVYDEMYEKGYRPYSAWFEGMSKKLKYDRRKISQELECDFLGSGDSVISPDLRNKIAKEMVKEPIEKFMSGELWVWKEPVKGHRYIMGLDVSRGDSEDFSSMNIIDFDDREQVVEYVGKIPPDDLASIAYRWGLMYECFIVIDITGGMGIATSRKLQEMSYKNLYIDGINTQNTWEYSSKLLEKIPGLNFNNKRTQIVAAFEEHIRHGFIIRSSRLHTELNTFVFINGRPDHMKGAHDDSIMSIAMALYVGDVCFAQLTKNTEINKSMMEAWTLSERTYEPNKSFYSYGKSFDPMGMVDPTTGMSIQNPLFQNDRMTHGKEAYQQYSWLFGTPKKPTQ